MRRTGIFVFFVASAALLLGCMGVLAQGIGDRNRPSSGGSHIITGKVFLPNGRPAQGVRVSLSGADFTSGNATSDQDGVFTFGGLPAGNYNISVRAEGFENETETLTIERFAAEGQGYQMTVHLRSPGQPKTSDNRSSNPRLAGVPKDAVAKFEKGVAKMSANDAKGALTHFDEATTAYPNFALAYCEKGAAYLRLNDPDKATESFVKAITIDQNYTEAKYGYGLAQFQKKEYTVAAAAFNDVLQQRKDMAEAHLNLGISLFYLKNIDAAIAELKTSITTKGGANLAMAHLYLGQIYAQKKMNSEAVAELQTYLDLAPKAPNADRIRSVIEDLKKKS
jgi:tetratricopeptide (TPR) repeat protein